MERFFRHSRAIHLPLTVTLICLVLVLGLLFISGKNSDRRSSRGIPLPFGTRSTSIRGQLSDVGSTTDNRRIVDMTFDKGEISETFGAGNLTFVTTPADPSAFSSGAPLSVALTTGKKFYGYKYTSMDATKEKEMQTVKNDFPLDAEGNPTAYSYSQLFPGTFFASDAELNDPDSFAYQFHDAQDVTFVSASRVSLDANARYLIIAEESGVTMTDRDLKWCGDGKTNAGCWWISYLRIPGPLPQYSNNLVNVSITRLGSGALALWQTKTSTNALSGLPIQFSFYSTDAGWTVPQTFYVPGGNVRVSQIWTSTLTHEKSLVFWMEHDTKSRIISSLFSAPNTWSDPQTIYEGYATISVYQPASGSVLPVFHDSSVVKISHDDRYNCLQKAGQTWWTYDTFADFRYSVKLSSRLFTVGEGWGALVPIVGRDWTILGRQAVGCNTIYTKSAPLSDQQYTAMIDIVFSKDVVHPSISWTDRTSVISNQTMSPVVDNPQTVQYSLTDGWQTVAN